MEEVMLAANLRQERGVNRNGYKCRAIFNRKGVPVEEGAHVGQFSIEC